MKKYFVLLGILFSTINLIAQTDTIPNSSDDKTVTITYCSKYHLNKTDVVWRCTT